jgi:soluble lytic murein transglycosylase-like protein
MLRRLATALACALSIFLLNQSTPLSNPAPVVKSAGVSAEQEGSASVASSEPKPADVLPARETDPTRSAFGKSATGSSIEAAIGKESDAKIDLDSKQNDRPQTSPQAAEPSRESICKVLSEAAEENDLPTPLFKRLIWQESRFRPHVVSPVGAKGIAQFMPRTAAERGLKNPFDPFQALPASAAFLRDLVEQFGNFGLAAAAYNGGPGRVSRWLAGKGGLPKETRDYVIQITGRPAEHWAEGSARAQPHPEAAEVKDCEVRPLQAAIAEARKSERAGTSRPNPEPANIVQRVAATWIALLTGNWSQQRAYTVYAGLQKKYPKVLGQRSPTVRVAKAPGKRSGPKTVVRLMADSRAEAEQLCSRLREAGGSCTVQRDPT